MRRRLVECIAWAIPGVIRRLRWTISIASGGRSIEPNSGRLEYGPFESEEFFAQAEASSHDEAGEVFGETERLELASELLEAASEAEFDDVLRDLIRRAGQAVGKSISLPEGNAIGSTWKGLQSEFYPALNWAQPLNLALDEFSGWNLKD